MRIILKGAVFLLSLILCFIIIARIAAAPAKEKSVEDTYEEWPYPISQEEIELIALVTMAEAEGETELGQRLVIDTILNRVDDSHFPDNITDVIFQPNQFTSMWNGRVDRCYVKEELVELVKEELLERTNYECVFFTAGGYSDYGVPMFQECCHYFSSYD
jgi:N-acetylmuramoyl-L-alanine amidase